MQTRTVLYWQKNNLNVQNWRNRTHFPHQPEASLLATTYVVWGKRELNVRLCRLTRGALFEGAPYWGAPWLRYSLLPPTDLVRPHLYQLVFGAFPHDPLMQRFLSK